MGLFGRRKDLTANGLQGSAVVKAIGEPQYPHTDKDNVHLSDFGLGSTLFPLQLDVTVDGRAAYTVTQTFRVPTKISNLEVGTTVPLYVDPADRTRSN